MMDTIENLIMKLQEEVKGVASTLTAIGFLFTDDAGVNIPPNENLQAIMFSLDDHLSRVADDMSKLHDSIPNSVLDLPYPSKQPQSGTGTV